MPRIARFATCLWFDTQAEDAARFYVSIFDKAKIIHTSHYTDVGREQHGMPAGTVMTVMFELDGRPFTALNGGPHFKFSEAISLEVYCDTQDAIDHFWDKLSKGGDPRAQQCGWLKDKFGVSWQIMPTALERMLADPDHEKAARAMKALLQMKKLDIAALQQAFNGS